MQKINSVIIEDEQRAVNTLKLLLKKTASHIKVVGVAKNVKQGVSCINETKPQLVFLDINLPDGDGFTVLDLVEHKSFEVIFTTAHDQYAVKAFEFAALDYLVKPFGAEKLRLAVNRYTKVVREYYLEEKVQILKESLNKEHQKIALPSSEGSLIVKLKDIIRCEASNNYSIIHLTNGKRPVITKSLGNLEETLCELQFFRVNNQYIVNMDYILKFEKGKGGHVILSDRTSISISVRRKKEFIERLNKYAKPI